MNVLIIGWDAATADHISDPTLDIPFWESLSHGGQLLADPPFDKAGYISSANAWTTLTTGATFDNHNILGFVFDEYKGHDYENLIKRLATNPRLPLLARRILIGRVLGALGAGTKGSLGEKVDSTSVQYKRIWEYFDDDALVYGLPLTYPVLEIDGIIVSGIPGPRPEEASYSTTYPKEIVNEIYEDRNAGYYVSSPNPMKNPTASTEKYCEEYRQQIFANAKAYVELYNNHQDEYNFDFGFLMLRALDSIMHATTDKDIIYDAYETADAATRYVVKSIKPDAVLLLSDHGMRPTSRFRKFLSSHIGLGKLVKMDHDAAAGVWSGSHDFDIVHHSDVTPSILSLYDIENSIPSQRSRTTQMTSEHDREEIQSRLEDLGYA